MICSKDLVVSEIACNHADLRYMLATDHLCKSTFECITAGGPSPAYVPTFHSVLSSTLSPYCSTAYQMLFATRWEKVATAHTLLYVLSTFHHFDVSYCNTSSDFVIKPVVKLNGFAWKQYQCTAPLKPNFLRSYIAST